MAFCLFCKKGPRTSHEMSSFPSCRLIQNTRTGCCTGRVSKCLVRNFQIFFKISVLSPYSCIQVIAHTAVEYDCTHDCT